MHEARSQQAPFELDVRHNNLLHLHVEAIKREKERLEKELKKEKAKSEQRDKENKQLNLQLQEFRMRAPQQKSDLDHGDFNRFVVGFHSASSHHIQMLGSAQRAFLEAGQDFVSQQTAATSDTVVDPSKSGTTFYFYGSYRSLVLTHSVQSPGPYVRLFFCQIVLKS